MRLNVVVMDKNAITPRTAEAVSFSPELIDAISAIQAARSAILSLQDSLQERDPSLLEEFGFQERINAQLEDIGTVHTSLLHLLADLADCTW